MTKLDANGRDHRSEGKYAFPKQRKEPIEDAKHVRNAIARFDQVKDVSDAEPDAAWKRCCQSNANRSPDDALRPVRTGA